LLRPQFTGANCSGNRLGAGYPTILPWDIPGDIPGDISGDIPAQAAFFNGLLGKTGRICYDGDRNDHQTLQRQSLAFPNTIQSAVQENRSEKPPGHTHLERCLRRHHTLPASPRQPDNPKDIPKDIQAEPQPTMHT